jgi:hypothetical protein
MMVFKKAIPRRTFLRAAGTTIALPLLDGMVPAFAATPPRPVKRMAFVYVPNGRIMADWTPGAEGALADLPRVLAPLARFQNRFTVLSGLSQLQALAAPGEEVGVHERPCGAYLTGVHPKWNDGADVRNSVSLDQIIAKEFGKETELASLELSLDAAGILGACEKGWSCAYINTLSWQSPTTPLPMEHDPRRVFERLFGDLESTNARDRGRRLRRNASLLDSLSEATADLLRDLGAADRSKLTEYVDAIRDVERRIDVAERQGAWELPSMERPIGVPTTYQEHAKVMFDLQVLAFQADLTRVITFMMGREKTDRPYGEIGIPDAHHPLTHHGGDPVKIEKCVKIETLQSELFAYYLDRLASTADGNGSLLDHMLMTFGSGISDGDSHSVRELPLLVFGAGAGGIKGGRHLRYPKDTPMANFYLTLVDKLGLPLEHFGDSTGRLDLLSV